MVHLPLSRVRTIMRTTDGVAAISIKSIYALKTATELFIKNLTTEAYEESGGAKKLSYSNLVNVVHNNSRYEFLEYIIPKKITVKQFKNIMEKQENEEEEEEDEEVEDEESVEEISDDSDTKEDWFFEEEEKPECIV